MQPQSEGPSPIAQVNRDDLAEFMNSAYNDTEFKTLCTSLKVDMSIFRGLSESTQKRYALIDYFERREGNYQKLLQKVLKDRPDRKQELLGTISQADEYFTPSSPFQFRSVQATGITLPDIQHPAPESTLSYQMQPLDAKLTLKDVHDKLQPTLTRTKLDEKTLADFTEQLSKVFSSARLQKNVNELNVSIDQFRQNINDTINALHVAYILREKINNADTSDLKVLWTDFFKCLDESRTYLEKAMEVMEQILLDSSEHP